MKKILSILSFTAIAFLVGTTAVYAVAYITSVGGTGTTSPTGILYGDNGATNHLNTTAITYPLQFIAGVLSSALSTTSSNTWGGTQTFTNAPIFSSLTGILKGNGSSAVSVASNGTDYSLISALSCAAGQHLATVLANGTFTCTVDSGGGGGSGNVATSSQETAGYLSYWTSTNATPATLGKVATSSLTTGLGLSLSQPVKFIGAADSVLTVATTTLFTGTTGQIPYFSGTNTITATSTGLVTCSGTASCGTGSYVLGPALSIVGSGLTSYDAWTHPGAGQSATTSLMLLNGNASTTGLTNSGSTWLTSLATAAGTFLAADPNGKVIATSTPSSGTAAGSTGQIQFNSSNAFAADSNLTFSTASKILEVGTTTNSVYVPVTFDNYTTGNVGTGNNTSSYTTAGTNRYLLVSTLAQGSAVCSAVTYAGVAMTQLAAIAPDTVVANEEIRLWGLANPTVGANNIVATCSGSSTTVVTAESFNGVRQVSAVEASNTATGNSASETVSVVTVTDNSWVAGFMRDLHSGTAGANTTMSGAAGGRNMIDTNAAQTPAGAHSLNVTQSPSDLWAMMAVSITPVPLMNGQSAKVGIGTSTPTATLSVEPFSGIASFLFSSFVGNLRYAYAYVLDQYNHIMTGGPAPSCGTGCSSVVGDDLNMRVVTGSTVSSATVNFANTWKNHSGTSITPVCIATEESAGTVTADASSTPSTVVLNFASALTSIRIAVHCEGSDNFTY